MKWVLSFLLILSVAAVLCFVVMPWFAALYMLIAGLVSEWLPWLYNLVKGIGEFLDIAVYGIVGFIVVTSVVEESSKRAVRYSFTTEASAKRLLAASGIICVLFAAILLVTWIMHESSWWQPLYTIVCFPLNALGIYQEACIATILLQLMYDLGLFGVDCIMLSRGKRLVPSFD